MNLTSKQEQTSLRDRLGYFGDLIYELVNADLKIKYKRSVLGIAWSMLNPLAQLLVYQFVFGTILPLRMPNFAAHLFIGILSFSWFAQSLSHATNAIVGNRSLVKRPGFPTLLLPVVSSVSQLIHFLLALPVLFAVLYFEGIKLGSSIVFLLPVILLQFIFSLSIGFFTASIYVKFRDIKYLIEIILRLFFFLTPIVYAVENVPERFLFYYRLNPLMHFIESYRSILMNNELPEMAPLLVIFGLTSLLLWGGYYIFIQSTHKFVEEV